MAVLHPSSCLLYREICPREQGIQQFGGGGGCSSVLIRRGGIFSPRSLSGRQGGARRELRVRAFWQSTSRPTSIEMESISTTEELDRILAVSKELSQVIVIDWFYEDQRKDVSDHLLVHGYVLSLGDLVRLEATEKKIKSEDIRKMASWCRKCIYLKPKLEKLAAEYHPRVKFYCVDVNKVPQALVKRGNISKMPTIQLWKDGEWKAEVIGGHKAWLVMDEVREMIQKHL